MSITDCPALICHPFAGTYYISDSAAGVGDTADYCKNFGASETAAALVLLCDWWLVVETELPWHS